MKLKNYGLNYQGSKNGIVELLCNYYLPLKKETIFWDIFGGGGAISHYVLKNNLCKNVIYNELNKTVFDGIKNAFYGNLKMPNEFITKEKFNSNDSNQVFIYSFNGRINTYAFGEYEELKEHAYFNFVFKNDAKLFIDLFNFNLNNYLNFENNQIENRWLFLKKIIKEEIIKNKIQSDFLKKYSLKHNLKNLLMFKTYENFQRVKNMVLTDEEKEKLCLFNKNYKDLNLKFLNLLNKKKQDYVIYCDPPYDNTTEYCFNKRKFNFQEFLNNVRKIDNIFISSYEINDPDFVSIMKLSKTNNFNKKTVFENLYTNKKTLAHYQPKLITLF